MIVTSTYTILLVIQRIQGHQLFIVSHYVLAAFVPHENSFNRHKSNIKIWFQNQGYLENITENEMPNFKFPSCNKVQRKKCKAIPFVDTYHTILKQLEEILHRNKNLLNMNAEVKQTFTPVIMVSYRNSRKLSSYLVRAKLYPINRIVGSKGCSKKQCEVCVSVYETNTFSSTVTGETFKVNLKLNYDDKYLIYLFTCDCCGRQYAWETTGEFRFRLINYKFSYRKYTKN